MMVFLASVPDAWLIWFFGTRIAVCLLFLNSNTRVRGESKTSKVTSTSRAPPQKAQARELMRMSAGINSFNIGAFDLVSGNRYGTSGAHYYKKDSVKTATAQSAKFLPIILEQHLKHSLDDYLLFSCIGKGLCGYEALGWTANNEMFGTRTHWMNLRVGDFVTNNPTTTDMLYT